MKATCHSAGSGQIDITTTGCYVFNLNEILHISCAYWFGPVGDIEYLQAHVPNDVSSVVFYGNSLWHTLHIMCTDERRLARIGHVHNLQSFIKFNDINIMSGHLHIFRIVAHSDEPNRRRLSSVLDIDYPEPSIYREWLQA